MYDDNRFGQPIDDVILFHDLIDGRKLRAIMSNHDSAMFYPQNSRIPEAHKRRSMGEKNVIAWNYENREGRKDTDKRLLKSLFLYLYRGTDPRFFPAEDDVDHASRGLVELVDNSPYADAYRKMCRLNRWHSDVIGRLIFDEIVGEADALNSMMQAGQQGEENEDEKDQQGEGEGQGQGQGDQQQEGGGQGQGQQGDGDQRGEGEGQGTPDATGEGEGEPDGKAAVSGNALPDAQTLVNRAIERVRSFTDNTEFSPDTSITKALEAAEKLGDGEHNPFAKHGVDIDMGSVADKMGRMRAVFDAEAADKIEFAPGAIVELTHGNDLRNVIPNEIALMSDPDLEILFDLKFLQRSLVVKKTEGSTRGGRGPIIMCIDVSGSMDVKSLSWAMSLAGAVGYTAASQGRDVAFIYYSNTVPDVILLDYENQYTLDDLERAINSIVYNQMIGTGVPHEHSAIPRMQEHGINRKCEANGGGTMYGVAFDAANDLMQMNPRWEKADLLFLTDGGDSHRAYSEERARILMDRGVRVFGIGLVDGDHRGRSQSGVITQMKANLGYFNAHATVFFGEGYSTDDVIKQVAEAL